MIDLQTAKKIFLQRWLLLFAMVACHVWLFWLGQNGVGTPMWDLNNVYAPWVAQMAETHRLLGIDANWIYPFPDIVPLALAAVISPSNYQLGWVVMVAILNLVALGALLGWRSRPNRQSLLAGWFWVAGLILLGPVSISRLDSVSVALAVLALAFLVRNKTGTAATLMAIGTWIKIWPLAFFLAAVGSREKLKRTWMVGFGTGLSILAVGILIAKPQYLFSFATGQVGRGIQIEAPVATPWLWMGIQNPVESGIRFSQQLLTFQVFGPFTVEFARLMDLVQVGALAITVFLAYRAGAKGSVGSALENQVVVWAFLTAILDLIVFNKVGSPQYYCWILVPVILAILWQVPHRGLLAVSAALVCLLTGLIFPIFYDQILNQEILATSLLTLRNVLAIGLLVWSNVSLSRLGMKQLGK